MKTMVGLDSKDVRTIIALFLGIEEERIIPSRYSFSVAGMTEEEIQKKMHKGE